ncbi:MAG: DUF5134 domain-containing protein [Pseudonocardiaceae bacterium]
MAGAVWVRWVFVAMFAALALICVARLIAASREVSAGGGTADRSVDVSRGVMSLGMIAMVVPWVDPLPRLYWQVLFGVAAGHIAVRLIRRSLRPTPVPCPELCGQHELHLMIGGLAMVYMLAAMPAGPAMAAGTSMTDRMDMAPMGSTGLALPALTWALIVYFLVFVVRLGARLAVHTIGTAPAGAGGPRGVVSSPHLLGSAEVVMGIGMSYMLLTML